MGGGSKNSSSTSTSTSTTVADRRVVADNGAIVIGDGVSATITATDLNAVQKGADVAQQAVIGATQVATSAQTAAAQVATRALDVGEAVIGKLTEAYDSASKNAQELASGNRTLVLVSLAAGALLLLNQATRRKAKA